jgi:phosphonate transport system substrate-binding protein
VLGPGAAEVFGADIATRLVDAFTALSPDVPEHAAILDLYTAGGFIPTAPENYAEIEQIATSLGLITG